MPYIKRESRKQYQEIISELAKLIPQDPTERPGHINYCISLLLERIYGKRLRYFQHNEVIGVLSCISQEFYRRKTAPYEEEKIIQEGDLDQI